MDAAKGETQTFQGREVLTLPEARPDIVDIIIDVGKALNYRVAGWDKERGIVRLDMTNSFAAKEFLGKFTKIHLIIHVKDGGGKLDLNIMVAGNYRTGTEQAAETFLEIFKNKLFERINRGSRTP